jgi:hypothetical protein
LIHPFANFDCEKKMSCNLCLRVSLDVRRGRLLRPFVICFLLRTVPVWSECKSYVADQPPVHFADGTPSHVLAGPLERPGCVLRGVHPRRRDRQVAHTYQETNGGRRTTFPPECVLIRAIQRTRPCFPRHALSSTTTHSSRKFFFLSSVDPAVLSSYNIA